MEKNFYVISFDGISGTGKSKIMRLVMGYLKHPRLYISGISENLVSRNRSSLSEVIDEIRNSDIGSEVERQKKEDYAVIISTANDRAKITETYIKFAKQLPGIFFIDRWFPTSMAYQSLSGISPEEILKINLKKGVYEPDLSFVLTCPPEIASDRIDKRTTKIARGLSGKMSTIITGNGSINKVASLDKKKRIQEMFLGLPSLLGEDKCVIVDTNRSYEAILYDIISEIKSKIFGGNKSYEHMAVIEAIEDDGLPEEVPFDNVIISG